MIRRSYGDRMQCWPSGINCQNFVLDKGTISKRRKSMRLQQKMSLNGKTNCLHFEMKIDNHILKLI